MNYYVYTLSRPDGTIFYVGKGCGKRVAQHEKEALRGHNCPKCELIRSIWREGGTVQRAIVFETDDERAALTYEADLIKTYAQDQLVNRIAGGRNRGCRPRLPKTGTERATQYGEKLEALFKSVLSPDGNKEYTLEQVADVLKQHGTPVSMSHIAKIRRGEVDDPSITTLEALSDFFGVDVTYWILAGPATPCSRSVTHRVARIQHQLAHGGYTLEQLQFIELMLTLLP
jgi:transcriptional regulator with XRE-family HTH domain